MARKPLRGQDRPALGANMESFVTGSTNTILAAQTALILGYAAKEPAYMKGRLSGPGVVHFAQYHRLSRTVRAQERLRRRAALDHPIH